MGDGKGAAGGFVGGKGGDDVRNMLTGPQLGGGGGGAGGDPFSQKDCKN